MTLTTTSQATSPTTELACSTRETAAACVDVLREVVDGLDPEVLLASEAPEVWSLFDAGEKLCSAAKTLVARKVDESGVWRDAGMRSAAEYLALQGGTTRKAAGDALRTSERVTRLPQVEDALRHGELSGAQAQVIADAADHDPACESSLLGHAKVASFKELRDECLRRKAAADPKPRDTRDRIHTNRYFRLSSDAEGAWRLSGRGPLDHAGFFGAILNPLIDDGFKQARAEGRREGRDAYAYDALQEMARLAHAAYYGDDLDSDIDEDTADHPDDASADDTGTDGQRTEARTCTADSRQPTDANPHPTGSASGDAGNGSGGAARQGRTAGLSDNAADWPGGQGVGSAPPGNSAGVPAGPGAGQDVPGDLGATDGGTGSSYSVDGDQPRLPGHSAPAAGAAGSGRSKARKNKKKRKKQPNPSHLAILRLDIEALRRGYTQDGELCEIQGVGPVPVETARDLLGDAIVKLVITKGTAVASVVHLGRGPTVAQRTALLWSQPECTVEGCPHTFTQIDHRHDWHLCHETALANLDRLCPHHHALKTHENWALVAGTGKRPMVPPGDPRHPGAATGKEVHRPRAHAV